MNHSFNVELAMEVGIEASIIFENIQHWVAKNEANGENIKNGYAWTYNSRAAWCELLPYMGEKQIRNALEKLLDAHLIERDTFSFGPMNRTYWYRLGERAKQFGLKGQTKVGRNGQTKTPVNTDINRTVSPSERESADQPTKAPKRATPRQRLAAHLGQCDQCPTEWANHASRSGFSQSDIDREWAKFVDHHTARGNVMADWFAAWRTWCRNAVEFAARDRSRGGRQGSSPDGNLASALRASVAERERRQRAEGSFGGREGNPEAGHRGGGIGADPDCTPIPF